MKLITQDAAPTLLIAEDDRDLRSKLAEFLRYEYNVLTAENGKQGFQMLIRNAEDIDLLITDIHMPKMTGLELLTKVKQHYPALPVIVMTAFPSPQLHEQFINRTIITYLEKPFNFDQLNAQIRRALKRKERRQRGFQGEVQVFGLADIVQLYCFSQVNAALRVRRETSQGPEQGDIYFEQGRVTHAICGEKHGEEAFYYIMSWEQGTFSTRYGVVAEKKEISNPWDVLVLEAMRRVDEQRTEGEDEDLNNYL